MKRLLVLMLILAFLPVSFIMAQSRQVTGVVTDDNGPVSGATVIEKDVPSNGTSTDANGAFTLTLKGRTGVLAISATGLLSREVTASSALVNIKMATDTKGLDEVVVVGYGRQKKITLTGSASSVTGATIRQNPSASLQNGLTGRLPGFSSQQRSGRPGDDGAAFFIRGQSSFTGGNNPLIIVDDIEYTYSQFSVIDPNEIESLTVLKDASTTAVYGVRGANGVVVVTTRRGKAGPPKISLRTEYASMEPTILPKYLDAYNTALAYNQAQFNDNRNAATPNPNFQPRFTQQDLDLFQNGQDPYGHPNINWQEVLFRKFSHQTRTNLDITGGTDRVKYFVSLGYINQGGILNNFSKGQGVDGNYFNRRFNYRSNLDIHVSNALDLRIDLYGNNSAVNIPNLRFNGKVNGDKNDAFYEYSSFLSLAPFAYGIKNPNGSWAFSNWQINNQTTYNANNIVGRLSLGGYERNFNDNMSFITSANLKLDFITRGLSAKGLISYASNYGYGRFERRQSFPSFVYDVTANTYLPRDASVYRTEPLQLTYEPRSTRRDLNVQAILNYDRSFGGHHVYGLGLINRNSRWFAGDVTYNFIPVNFQGISSRIGYDYKQRYLLQFNAGYNGSDRFVGSKRYGFFPAVSAGWNVAEESFFKKLAPFVNQLKLRGSYGLVGSDQISGDFTYAYQSIYGYNTTGYNNSNTSFTGYTSTRIYQANFGVSSTFYTNFQEGTLANLDVTWEKERKLDLGIDFSLFNGKISGVVDVFRNNRYDILTSRGSVSQILGQTLPPVNIGETRNRGYEVELTYRDRIGKDFTFSVRGTYSKAKNIVVNRDEAPPIQAYQAFTGQSIGQILLYKWTGTYYKDADDIAKSPKIRHSGVNITRPGDLKYEDVNKDGFVDEFDRGFFSSPNLPQVVYGAELNLGYKGFRFNVLFQGTGDFGVNGIEESIRAFSANLTSVHQQAWTPELGNNAKYPLLSLATRGISDPGGTTNSTFWYRSGKYLRLRTAEISYSLPRSVLNKLRVNDIRIYVNGNNLATWSKFNDFYSLDPEVVPGTDRTSYPPQRVYNVGLNVTF